MTLDEGVQVEGAAVKGVAFHFAIDSKDCVDGVDEEVRSHNEKKKAPVREPEGETRREYVTPF